MPGLGPVVIARSRDGGIDYVDDTVNYIKGKLNYCRTVDGEGRERESVRASGERHLHSCCFVSSPTATSRAVRSKVNRLRENFRITQIS